METLNIVDFCKANNIKSVSKVRENTNKYPFITLLYPDPLAPNGNGAMNLYFTKSSAGDVHVGQNPVQFFSKLEVYQVENAAGEPRTKVGFANVNYTSIEELFAEVVESEAVTV